MSLTSRASFIAALVLAGLALVVYLLSGVVVDAYYGSLHWVYAKQREFHQSMTASMSALADGQSLATAYAVIAGSFLYGVFHAAGPGHGKVVLSTYLLAKPESLGKSLAMASASSLLQGAVAVFLVYGLLFLFDAVPKDSRSAALWSERLSYALVIGIGLWLLWRAFKAIRASAGHDHSHDHYDHAHHHHDYSHAHGHSQTHDHHEHNHAHDAVCSQCGHAHFPDADQVDQAKDWRSVLGVIFSIGLRPCSGAILVLIFARFAGISWAGVVAVFAMSVGTAITVSTLALIAVKGRDFASRLVSANNQIVSWASSGTAAVGGLVLVLFGYGLLAGSFSAPVRSMGLG